jgi:hypothetical protein
MLTRRMPIKGPRTKKCAVKTCRAPFVPEKTFITWCSPDCGHAIAVAKLAKQKTAQARAARKAVRDDRAETRTRKEALKRKGEHLNEAQAAFNAYIRYRDRDQPCICCGAFDAAGAGGVGGGWDAGHWLSRGHAPHLRFHEQNVHKQRKGCNRPGGTTRIRYREGLVRRIGLDAVGALERLEYAPTEKRWTVDELIAIKKEYRAKLRAMKEAA